MTMLKLAAVDFNNGARIAEKGLRGRLYRARLPRTRRPEKQEVSNRSALRGEPSQISLIRPDDLVDCLFLPNNEAMKCFIKLLGLRSSRGCIQQLEDRLS